jgi:hypothetical protein
MQILVETDHHLNLPRFLFFRLSSCNCPGIPHPPKQFVENWMKSMWRKGIMRGINWDMFLRVKLVMNRWVHVVALFRLLLVLMLLAMMGRE